MAAVGGEAALPLSVAEAEVAVAAGDGELIHKRAEVLGAHVGLPLDQHVVPAHQLDHGLFRQGGHPLVVDHAGVAFHQAHLGLRPHGRGHALHQRAEHFAHPPAHLRAEGADDALKLCLGGDDVARGARVEGANRDHHVVGGIDPAGGEGLQGHQDLSGHRDGVDARAGIGAVAALAPDGDGKAVGGRVAGAVFQAVLPGLGAGGVMAAENRVHMGVFQAALVHHALGTAVALLIGLEKQLHRAAQLLPVGRQQPGRPQKGRGVQVVAAGVHHTRILRGKGQAGLLLHGQGVDVRPQADGPACLSAPDDAQNARAGAGPGLDAHGRQLPKDQGLGAGLLPAQLRVGVDVPAKAGHIAGQVFCFL